MKKMFVIFLAVIMMACSDEFGEGGKNAAQYVRETMPEYVAEAESVKAIQVVDGAIIDISEMLFNLKMLNYDVTTGVKTDDELTQEAERMDLLYNVSFASWNGDEESRKKAEEAGCKEWRKIYTVEITMKSQKKKTVYVIMEKDGITPFKNEIEYKKDNEEFIRFVASASIPVI